MVVKINLALSVMNTLEILESKSDVNSAGNLGINRALVKYITFIDGDDYINFNYISILMSYIAFTSC